MTERPDLTPLRELYDQSVKQHGATPPGVGCRTEDSQDHRFSRLLSVVDQDQPFTINDLGCGYGAFFDYIQRRGMDVQKFVGYELSEEMLTAARKRLPAEAVELIRADRPTRMADYTFASGIFNVRLDVDEGTWVGYMRATLRAMAEQSTRGFGFNALTTYNTYEDPHLHYASPTEWFDWCKTELTPRVSLFHDYPLFEWTITGRF